MEPQLIFNILVALFGSGGLLALGTFLLGFRKQGTEEILASRNVLVDDNARLKSELKDVGAEIVRLLSTQKLERDDLLRRISDSAAQNSADLATIAAQHLQDLAIAAANYLKEIAAAKAIHDLQVIELQKQIDKKDAAIDELTKRIALHQ